MHGIGAARNQRVPPFEFLTPRPLDIGASIGKPVTVADEFRR